MSVEKGPLTLRRRAFLRRQLAFFLINPEMVSYNG